MSTLNRSALLIVQPDFMSVHVGVRRVILFYWDQLARAGFDVRLATPEAGVLRLAEPIRRDIVKAQSHGSDRFVLPCWSSKDPVYRTRTSMVSPTTYDLRWSSQTADPETYDVSIITAPWLQAFGLPHAKYSAGIVYDMIPNLIACGALDFGIAMNTYKFAHEHDLGNKFYLDYCDAVFAISESTRSDFLGFYPKADAKAVTTVVPFTTPKPAPLDRFNRLRKALHNRTYNILLVNAFDPRKNFSAMAAVFRQLDARRPIHITFVGRERAMSITAVLSFLNDLRDIGADVTWYNEAGDQQLDSLYRQSNLLVFPSFYEGLGLPVLEAQSYGVPVVSSRSSSCLEVNMNKNLCVDVDDRELLANTIMAVIDQKVDYHRSATLMKHLDMTIGQINRVPLLG